MRSLLYILFFFVFIGSAQVNLSTYGVVGDGVNDDTAELQAAFDSGNDLVANANLTFRVSSTINIDTNSEQTVDFNNATFSKIGNYDWVLIINKSAFSNSLTTLTDFKVDGNNNGGKSIDIRSRVHFTNVEIFDFINDNANGIRALIYDDPGVYGQWVFDNVDIHNLESLNSDGSSGNNSGMVHGFLSSVQEVPSSPTQIVYKNSEIYELWGEDAGGVTLNSPGLDTSNSNVSFWFENNQIRDAQRRTVKNFIGNTTWINNTFTSAANDNPKLVPPPAGLAPAGLFVIGASSSALGATNNLICGCEFKGPDSDPFDGWYTQFLVDGQNGPADMEMRNSTFTGGHGGRYNRNGITMLRTVGDVTIANTTFGTTNTVFSGGGTFGTILMDSNNTYVDGKSTVLANLNATYSEPSIAFEACPTIGGVTVSTLSGIRWTNPNTNTEAGTSDFRLYIDEGLTDMVFDLEAIDSDGGQTHTFTKTGGGNDPGFFTISGSQAIMDNGSTFTPDFSNPLDSNTNNIYAFDLMATASPSGETFVQNMILYIQEDTNPTTQPVTSIAFLDLDQTIRVGEKVDTSFQFNGGVTVPDNTGFSFTTEEVNVLINNEGVGFKEGETTFSVIADDNSDGFKQSTMNVTILPRANDGRALKRTKRFKRRRR